jgi:lipopolysaccharide transport system ATP-binding protein
MSSDIAIKVENLSKCYQIYDKPRDRLLQGIMPRLQRLAGKQPKQYCREFWALRDVSFEIKRGETFGVVGRNGSGKSTLLQLIAGTLMPSEGTLAVNGRIAALLELGSGFNPEFTGLENIFLNGAIFGLGKTEIETRLDDILSFADIGDFIHQQVKTYSSGMFVRLAFAVQVCLDPDIMIVDEALAVGDIFFRQKCYARLQQLREKGCSIMLVSHATTEVEQFCERALLLDHGTARFVGNASEAIKHYYLIVQNKMPVPKLEVVQDGTINSDFQKVLEAVPDICWPDDELFTIANNLSQVSNGWARCIRYALCDSSGSQCSSFEQGQAANFFYEFEVSQAIGVPLAGLVIQNDKGVIVHGKGSLEYGTSAPMGIAAGAIVRCVQRIELCLAPGEYSFELGLATIPSDYYDNKSSIDHNQLFGNILRLCHIPQAGIFCITLRRKHEGAQLTHHGVADLPGSFNFIGELL